MEMSGFTAEQLDVREAVSKICSNYPDVCLTGSGEYHHQLTMTRNTGRSMMSPENIPMIYMLT